MKASESEVRLDDNKDIAKDDDDDNLQKVYESIKTSKSPKGVSVESRVKAYFLYQYKQSQQQVNKQKQVESCNKSPSYGMSFLEV